MCDCTVAHTSVVEGDLSVVTDKNEDLGDPSTEHSITIV